MDWKVTWMGQHRWFRTQHEAKAWAAAQVAAWMNAGGKAPVHHVVYQPSGKIVATYGGAGGGLSGAFAAARPRKGAGSAPGQASFIFGPQVKPGFRIAGSRCQGPDGRFVKKTECGLPPAQVRTGCRDAAGDFMPLPQCRRQGVAGLEGAGDVDFPIGARVRHVVYGPGTVEKWFFHKGDPTAIYIVRFDYDPNTGRRTGYSRSYISASELHRVRR